MTAERTAVAYAAPNLHEQEFALFQALVRREAGIFLGSHKKALLVARLAPRLRALGVKSFIEYYRRATAAGDRAELVQLLDCICTNETRFFREPAQFELLEREIAAAWGRPTSATLLDPDGAPRRVRVWSAACSTGEEPYSVAMSLLATLPLSRTPLEILGTDLSSKAIERATAAIWPIDQAAEIPVDYLRAFMLRGVGPQQGKMKAGPRLRRVVTFQRLNLHVGAYPPGLFDLILCRNVLIYFDRPEREAIVDRLVQSLAPGGYLFLGHAESLNALPDRVETLMPAVYRLRAPARQSEAHSGERAPDRADARGSASTAR